MSESFTTKHKSIERFVEALQQLPDSRAELIGPGRPLPSAGRPFDARISLEIGGKSIVLLIHARSAVFPRDVREALWQIRSQEQGAGPGTGQAQPMVIGEFISPGAKELLKAERIGYYDGGGSMYLPAPGLYLYVDKPDSRPMASSIRSLFSGRRAQVLHALLAQPKEWFGVIEVANRSLVSPSTVSQVFAELEQWDWLTARGKGPRKERYLREPGKLLDTWVKQLPLLPHRQVEKYYVPRARGDLDEMGSIFESFQAEYAVTQEAAAQRYAPFISNVSQVRVRLLEGSAADAAIAAIGARPVSEGVSLTVVRVESAGELLFRQRIGRVWLASPVQVYLDLMESVGRAKEMADHLRAERLGF